MTLARAFWLSGMLPVTMWVSWRTITRRTGLKGKNTKPWMGY